MREICIYRPQVSPQEFSKPSNDEPARRLPLIRTKHTSFCLIVYNIITIRRTSSIQFDRRTITFIVFFTAENVTVEFTDTINDNVYVDYSIAGILSNAIIPDDLKRQQCT